ncbi:uncharacterized protein [Ptychodera flava]|uniref:uncharacterized protein n=1 Tax=Ptychodera flava TaxID=63121 RepID=UPI003969D1B4
MQVSLFAFVCLALLACGLAEKPSKKDFLKQMLKVKKSDIASRVQEKGIKLGQNKKQYEVDALCNDLCPYAADGECDDGRPGSDYDICVTGSDCTDCGYVNLDARCNDGCPFSNDGECDDGRPGAAYALCPLGSDCADCGAAEFEHDPACNDQCNFANDGECDDGGVNSVYSLCEIGSDCSDCGYRLPADMEDLIHDIGQELEDLFEQDSESASEWLPDSFFSFGDWYKRSNAAKAKNPISPAKKAEIIKQLQNK